MTLATTARTAPIAPSALTRATQWRALLVAGCVAAAAGAGWLATPSAALLADPELARLLRGMALLKGVLVLLAIAVLWWRFARPLADRTAALYLAGAWLASAATLLVWQLAQLPVAILLFHAGELTLLLVGWRDGLARPRRAAIPPPA